MRSVQDLTIFRFYDILIFSMTQIQENVIIRQRGQLTIPYKIRKLYKWLQPGSIVTIISDRPDRIIICPFKPVMI